MLWIELLIILIILAYGWGGWRRGFISQALDLLGIVVSFLFALGLYAQAGTILENLGVNPNLSKPLGFFAVWVIAQLIFYLLTILILRLIPEGIRASKADHYLGIFPGAAKGLVIISIILMLLFVLPFAPNLKDDLIDRPVSGFIIKSTTKISNRVEKVFGEINTLTFLSPPNQSEETTQLNFRTEAFELDEDSEKEMVSLVNAARAKAGLKSLKVDERIRHVARLHSQDMAKNGYFSHVNLAGKSPADRMLAGGVNFFLAGENLALAPNVELAEIGFMNSPKHRDNILDAKFGRIGIGVIDLGVYGRMITQNFAD